jgi:DNA-binding transcriptional MerR regulator
MLREAEDIDPVTTAESAAILNCCPDNVRLLARQGKLRPVMVVGNIRVFDRRDVEALRDARAAARSRRARVETVCT